jgi:hypothetical protein
VTEYVTGRDTKAEQLLWLLNGRQSVALNEITFVVITGTWTPSPTEPPEWPFRRGEIIPVVYTPDVYEGRDWVSGGYQQEVFGACRSFQPWAMLNVVKEAYNVDDAAEIAQLATDGPDGFYECPYGEWRLFSDQDVGRRRWAGACDEYLRIGDASVDRW